MNSPTSSVNSSCISLEKNKKGPRQSSYLKSHKNLSFSFVEGLDTFQQGYLGDNDTFLVGTLNLNYQKPCHVKSIYLNFKGTEKTTWQRSQARSKSIYTGEYPLVDQSNKIWEAFNDTEEITTLDIPFKIQIPYNLPETITTEIGTIHYQLRATINTKSLIGTAQQLIKVKCPIKRTIILDNQQSPPYKILGEVPNGIDYTFILPPNKSFNLGTYVSIPMRMKFLQANVGIERIEVILRTSMNFHSSSQGESKHVDQQIVGMIVPRSELQYYQGECTYTINLFVPKNVQPTYQGRFISIVHFLNIKFYLYGFDESYDVEENVRIAHILENHPINSSSHVPISPQATTSIPPEHISTPSPIHHTHSQYSKLSQQSFDQVNRGFETFNNNPLQISLNHPRNLFDKPFDGYNAIPQSLNFNLSPYDIQRLDKGLYRPDHPSMSSGTSVSSYASYDTTNSSISGEITNDQTIYPTQLSPPPYRQPLNDPK
ncbi:20578_t:CDS:1 [Funneliformis geosporum]|uniref:5766_t:CDS:1 n=1 Tax=Funneliformis geosporum TaxID=1117311 RepID=A0A9W4WTN3_9GLOM|nr:20578_t:CDS:1 [Funneliformis geosporum]CAI2178108.1 5766_t:CDS:1 [Funneliformis geosporum]